MTGEEMAEAAGAWFSSLGQWPEESVEVTALQNYRTKTETPGYYGVAAVLLQLIAANDGKWPPMSPRNFARQFSNPEAIEQIERYAKNVAIVEETYQ